MSLSKPSLWVSTVCKGCGSMSFLRIQNPAPFPTFHFDVSGSRSRIQILKCFNKQKLIQKIFFLIDFIYFLCIFSCFLDHFKPETRSVPGFSFGPRFVVWIRVQKTHKDPTGSRYTTIWSLLRSSKQITVFN